MKAKDLAARLHGMDLGDVPYDLNREASRAGLVVVIGVSTDTVEFYGAIEDVADIPEGGTLYFDAAGLLPDPEDVARAYEEDQREYYERKKFAASLDAEWQKDGFDWTFTMVPPHSRFVVNKDGARYCRGIIFALSQAGIAL